MLFSLFWFTSGERWDIKEGEVVTRDIISPRSVEIIDVPSTAEAQKRILSTVPTVYRIDLQMVNKIREELEEFFSSLEEVRPAYSVLSEEFRDTFSKEWKITPGVLEWLLAAPQEEYEKVKGIAFDLINRYLAHPIREEELEDKILEAYSELDRMDLTAEEARVAEALIFRFIRPTAVVDVEGTQRERLEALESLQPAKRIIKRGEVILRKGEVVTKEDIEILRAVGLGGERERWFQLLAWALVIAGLVGGEYLYIRKADPALLEKDSLLLLRLLTVGGIVAMNMLTFRFSPFFVVISALPLILSPILGKNLALVESLIIFPLLLWGDKMDFLQGFYVYINLLFPLFWLDEVTKMKDLARAGMMMALINASLSLVFGLQEGKEITRVLGDAFYGLGGGIGGAVIALGGIILLESAFHVTSDLRLMELLNPTHPLLKRLLLEAPGTYSHSLMVANLAEAAAERIGANPFLVRVGAYYHDIGKIKRPYCFIENQVKGRNIHDRLSPNLSALVIQSHVKDGVEIARQYNLPPEIQEIIARHHGTTVIRYFYDKAVRERKDEVREEEFRYPGPLPHTAEEALVFLADSVEAAVRGATNLTPGRVGGIVNGILQKYLREGQLDESPLTMRDIRQIAQAFVAVLNGMIHSRVPYYPEEEALKMAREKEVKNEPSRNNKQN
ncbi:MAG TPA: HDIG domain-containing protein [Candidatus Atribacteria bacterium]|nr:HDIG domain-containing protein [Candidatus Atribacteria bacterium]HQE24881.1 HDIG domain-containing protein [Candidatus Atribacteria bacterium]